MLKIALTGNIASGKSTVQKILEDLGSPVLDTDICCHKLLAKSSEIKNAFKEYDVFENNEISRDKLGKLVFSNPILKKQLEDLLYPDLKCEIEKFFNTHSDKKFSFVGIPQLFEAGMENLFDRIIFVYCDDTKRLERLISRNNYTEEYAKIRISSQLTQDEKTKLSDYVIYNNSDLKNLETEVVKLIEQIR